MPPCRRCKSAAAARSQRWRWIQTCARARSAPAPSWPSAPPWHRTPARRAWRTAAWLAWLCLPSTRTTNSAWLMRTPPRRLSRRCGSSRTAPAWRSAPHGCWHRWHRRSPAGSALRRRARSRRCIQRCVRTAQAARAWLSAPPRRWARWPPMMTSWWRRAPKAAPRCWLRQCALTSPPRRYRRPARMRCWRRRSAPPARRSAPSRPRGLKGCVWRCTRTRLPTPMMVWTRTPSQPPSAPLQPPSAWSGRRRRHPRAAPSPAARRRRRAALRQR